MDAANKSRAKKVAISLPPELLEAADRECQARGQSRSAFFRAAVEALLAAEREREAVERYIEGYRKYPETEEEVAEVDAIGSATLAQEPWQ